MAFTPKRLAQFVATTGEVTYYTVESGRKAVIKNIVIVNTSAAAVSLALSLVPFGAAAGNSNRIIPTVTIPPNALVPFDMTQVLESQDFISAIASVGSAITVTISGLEGV